MFWNRAAGLSLSAVLLVAVSSVSAASLPLTPESRTQLEGEIGEASREEQAVVRRVLVARERRKAAEGASAELGKAISVAGARVHDAEVLITELALRAREVLAQLEQAEAELVAARLQLRKTAAELYKSGGGSEAIATLVGDATSLHEVVVGKRYLEDAGRRSATDYKAFVTQRDRVRAAKQQVIADETAAREARSVAATEQLRLSGLLADMTRKSSEARTLEAEEGAALSVVQARKGEFERRLAEVQKASNRIGSILGDRPGGTRPGSLSLPARGGIASPFGWRVHPIYGDRRLHAGIDIDAPHGAPVRAAADGTVVIAGYQTGYGNTVVIDHGGGLATLSAHLSVISVSAGQTVSGGQLVGAVGNTGNSTGPHLHFEVRINGSPVDPMGYL
ncbi:MAG: hypothetical protein EXQ69_07450 [Acidimicrobiia bacterium]|nr:hypothetical protein [Acidimicrobiia bacterium]